MVEVDLPVDSQRVQKLFRVDSAYDSDGSEGINSVSVTSAYCSPPAISSASIRRLFITNCSLCNCRASRPIYLPCKLNAEADQNNFPSKANNGHFFCKHCIENWLLNSSNCPSCGNVLPQSFIRRLFHQEIRSMRNIETRLCRNHDRGCDVRSPSKISNFLHEARCLYELTRCPYAGCSMSVERGKLKSHIEMCLFSKIRHWNDWKPDHRIDPPRENLSTKTVSIKQKWLDAPSSVADLVILPNNTTAVICFRGQILALANSPSPTAQVVWSSRVAWPLEMGHTRLCHAAFDPTTNRIYFTGCPLEIGILWADLDKIESTSRDPMEYVELKALLTRTSSSRSRQYWGISAIPQLQALAVCQRYPNTIGIWSATKQCGDSASSQLLHEIMFNPELVPATLPFLPFRCVSYVSFIQPANQNHAATWHVIIAVDDYKNSRLHLIGLKAVDQRQQPQSPVNSVDDQFKFDSMFEQALSCKGTQNGFVRSPDGLHFDPSGKLFVADSGNMRIQIFAALGGIQAQWDEALAARSSCGRTLTMRRRSNSDLGRWCCVWSSSQAMALGRYAESAPSWCSMKVSAVVTPLDPTSNQPFLLAGLWDDEDAVCFR